MKDKLPYEKGFHVSWDQIHRDSRALAWRLENKGPENGHWRGLIAITRGGMVPAMIIARELDIRLVETISIKSYDHKNQSEAKILKDPNANLISDGSGIVIIDDLVATGGTAIACAELLTENFNVRNEDILILSIIDLTDLGGSKLIKEKGFSIKTIVDYD